MKNSHIPSLFINDRTSMTPNQSLEPVVIMDAKQQQQLHQQSQYSPSNGHARACSIFFPHDEDRKRRASLLIEQQQGSCSEATDDDSYSGFSIHQVERHVRFAVTVKKHIIINRGDYTEDEWKRCWYSESEEQRAARRRKTIIERMESGKCERRNMTYRGLETTTEKGRLEFDLAVNSCIDTVMDEQDRQWYDTRVDDYDRIAELCLAVTARCKEQALKRGLKDAEEAWECFDEISSVAADDMSSFRSEDDDNLFSDLSSPETPGKKQIKVARRKLVRRMDPPGDRGRKSSSTSLPVVKQTRNKGRQPTRRRRTSGGSSRDKQ